MKIFRLTLSALMLLTALTIVFPTFAAEKSNVTTEREGNDTFDTATPAEFGKPVVGYISAADDADTFKIPTSFIGDAELTLAVPYDYDLYIYDQDYNQLAVSKRLGRITEKVDLYVNSTTTQLYVRIVPYGKVVSNQEAYTLTTTRF